MPMPHDTAANLTKESGRQDLRNWEREGRRGRVDDGLLTLLEGKRVDELDGFGVRRVEVVHSYLTVPCGTSGTF